MHHLRRSLSDLTSADGYFSSVRRVGLHETGLSTDPCVHKRTSEERQVHSKTSVQSQAKNEQSTNAFEAVSFCCLSSDNRFRRVIISLVRWRWFERIAILVIMLNCIMLAMYDPLDRACSTSRCQTLEFLEPFVFTFFALEMLVKMIAMGVWGGRSYFADAWNIMDFLIVITGLVDVLGIRGSYLMIARMGRILRPLRAINRVPSIRILVSLLMDTIPMLGNVLLLAFLVFSVFGIIGVQMFQGKLRNRCYPDNNFNSSYLNTSAERLFATPFFVPVLSTDFLCHLKGDHGTQSCDEVPKWFGNAECTQGYGLNASFDNRTNSTCLDMNRRFRTCKPDGPNPYYGSVSFDDIALAWVFIYQVVTLEGWSDLMYLIQDAYSFWTWIYFVVLISIGSFFLVNLALVVIMMQFSETKRREIKLMREHKKMAVTASQLSLYSDLRNVWVYLRQLLYCAKRTEHVHHIHQHQHVHVHQHMFQCEQCKKMSVVSSPPDSATIPNIEISCFEEENPCSPLYTRRRSLSCPSMLTIGSHHGNFGHCSPGNDQHDKAHATLSATSSVDSAMAIGRPYLRPVESYQSKAKSGLPNTICVQAEAISAVSIKCPKKASISSRTSISLRINSAAGEVNTNATCTANSDAGGNTKTKMSTTTRFNIPPRKASNISLSSVSTDYDFNSDLMDGSMFDLSHSDKYYISQTPSHVQRFRLYCKNISESPRTALGVMVVIILNTVCMGIEHHNQPQTMTTVLEYFNLGFIWIFTLEMLIKMMSTGIKAYFKNGFNIFDSIVVLLSILEIVVGNGSGGNFIVLRSLRLLRIFKLVRPMRHQMVVMIRTMSSVLTFFSLLFLFMFTFAILGMNIFGGKFSFPNRMGVMLQPRSNFDSFLWSMITVFQILTQEDWNLVLYDGIRATNLWATVYFISLMTIGYYVLLNLLVAILVEGFTTPLDKGRMAERIAGLLRSKARKLSLMKRAVSLPDVLPLATEEEEETQQVDSRTFPRLVQRPLEARRCTLGVLQLSRKANFHSSLYEIPHVECQREKLKKNEPVLLSAKRTGFFGDKPALEMTARSPISDSDISQEFKIVDDSSALLHCFPCAKRRRHWSLYLFHPKSKTRLMMKKICSSKWFDYFILVLIIYSCVLLGVETPELLDRSGLKHVIIDWSTFVMTWIFFMEMVIKVIARGLYFENDAYLRNGWNVLDFFMVLISICDVLATSVMRDATQHTDILKALRVLRAARALRPLRMIRQARGLKVVVQTLLYSLKPIGNTVLIAMVFFIVFGILGVQLMKGAFYYCRGVDMNEVSNRIECEQHPNGYWTNYQYNFDNLFEALITLFVISTKDGWVDIMRRGIDARGIDLQPRKDWSLWRLVYFIFFLLIGGFLILNMIVGVVVENFQRCQKLQGDEDKAKIILEKWQSYLYEKRKGFWKSYPPWRKKVYRTCTHTYWDVAITMLIFSNVVVMALEHYKMSKTYTVILEVSNAIFTALYFLEAIVLITALGIRRYFRDKWHCFDMLVVVVSVIGIILENVNFVKDMISVNPAAIRAMRLLRVVRVLKLLKMAKGLRFLLDHVAETIPQVTNLGLLFSLLFFVYSCLGMQLFGTLQCDTRYTCSGLGRHANFQNLGNSMLTLFRIATGDNWSGILKDTLRPDCNNRPDCKVNCCLTRYVSPIFFISFVLFAQFVLVNIVIAVLMKHLRMPEERVQKRTGSRKKSSVKGDPHLHKQVLSRWQDLVKRKVSRQESGDKEHLKPTVTPERRIKSNSKSTEAQSHVRIEVHRSDDRLSKTFPLKLADNPLSRSVHRNVAAADISLQFQAENKKQEPDPAAWHGLGESPLGRHKSPGKISPDDLARREIEGPPCTFLSTREEQQELGSGNEVATGTRHEACQLLLDTSRRVGSFTSLKRNTRTSSLRLAKHAPLKVMVRSFTFDTDRSFHPDADPVAPNGIEGTESHQRSVSQVQASCVGVNAPYKQVCETLHMVKLTGPGVLSNDTYVNSEINKLKNYKRSVPAMSISRADEIVDNQGRCSEKESQDVRCLATSPEKKDLLPTTRPACENSCAKQALEGGFEKACLQSVKADSRKISKDTPSFSSKFKECSMETAQEASEDGAILSDAP